jgi:acetolactate synthase-1/2/3 large subunit
MLPLSSSYLDQEPLLAISAQIPDDFPASHTHQLLPLREAYGPITRYTAKITAENAGEVTSRALAECMTRPFGAAYLTLSAREALKPINGPQSQLRNSRPVDPKGNAGKTARELIDALGKAKRPLVLIGLGADQSNAERLRQWLNGWGLPAAVTPKVKGIVDETADNFVGVIGGMAADGLMREAIDAADLLIGFGLDPVEIDQTWHAELPIFWILEAPNVGGMLPDGTELVDHAQILDALHQEQLPAEWGAPFRAFQQKRRDLLNGTAGTAGTMWPGDLVQTLASVMPPETIVTTDVGSHKYLFGQFWPSRKPETFWMSNGLSGMSYGLSAAIGAKLARPDVPVLAAVGDGGFSMNSQELETAARVGAPFITVVLEDQSYSLIRLSQENRKLEPYRTDFQRIDSVKAAEACGVAGLRTSDPGTMAAAVTRALERNSSLVVEVPVAYADYRRLF